MRVFMKNDVSVRSDITIPDSEIEIATSRAGGPGGQHVNKSNTRITVRWNINNTTALDDQQKARVLQKLASELTNEGDLIVHSSASRSQQQNKEAALSILAAKVKKALHVPKRRMKTRVSKSVKESRLQDKKRRSQLKQSRGKTDY
jgi:ribosome-associated protein